MPLWACVKGLSMKPRALWRTFPPRTDGRRLETEKRKSRRRKLYDVFDDGDNESGNRGARIPSSSSVVASDGVQVAMECS